MNLLFLGFDQIIYLLTLSGADVNHRTADGFTPLYMAASRGVRMRCYS